MNESDKTVTVGGVRYRLPSQTAQTMSEPPKRLDSPELAVLWTYADVPTFCRPCCGSQKRIAMHTQGWQTAAGALVFLLGMFLGIVVGSFVISTMMSPTPDAEGSRGSAEEPLDTSLLPVEVRFGRSTFVNIPPCKTALTNTLDKLGGLGVRRDMCFSTPDDVMSYYYDENLFYRVLKARSTTKPSEIRAPLPVGVFWTPSPMEGDMDDFSLGLEILTETGELRSVLVRHSSLVQTLREWETYAIAASSYTDAGDQPGPQCACPAYFGIASPLWFYQAAANAPWEVRFAHSVVKENENTDLVQTTYHYEGYPSKLQRELLGANFEGSTHYSLFYVDYVSASTVNTAFRRRDALKKMLQSGETTNNWLYVGVGELEKTEAKLVGEHAICYQHCETVRKMLVN